MMSTPLDPSTLGTSSGAVLRAVAASWVVADHGPTLARLANHVGVSRTSVSHLFIRLRSTGWLTSDGDAPNSTRLTHAAYRALGWDEPVAAANRVEA
jgi:DNA-binding IclR family transcriptional regulator